MRSAHVGPYLVGACLLATWFCFNYTALMGIAPITSVPMHPAVPPEYVGRILGWIDAGCGQFLAWMYQTTRQSAAKDDTIHKLAGD